MKENLMIYDKDPTNTYHGTVYMYTITVNYLEIASLYKINFLIP